MSSSGKGQSHVKSEAHIDHAWIYALEAGRKREMRVIVEGQVDFDFEIKVLYHLFYDKELLQVFFTENSVIWSN